MSCLIIRPLRSGTNVCWSLQQSLRNSIGESKNVINCRRLTGFTDYARNFALCGISSERHENSCLSSFSWHGQFKSQDFLMGSGDGIAISRNFYCTKPDCNNLTNESDEKKLTVFQKLKKLWKEYWYVLFPVHAVTSVFWYGSFYYLVASGIDIPALLTSLGAPESWCEALRNSQAGNFVLAYTLYKVATPIRYTVTVGGTTLSVNLLKKWGWVRPVPTAEQLKQMCRDQKEALKGLKATCQDKMQVTKDEFLKSKNAMTRQLLEAQEGLHRSIREVEEEAKTATQDFKYLGKAVASKLKRTGNSFDYKK